MDIDDRLAQYKAESDRLGDFVNAKVQEIKALREENEALKAQNASQAKKLEEMRDRMEGHVAQLKEFRAQLEALGADTRHIIELREDGFTIMHPLACRPNLFDCRYNVAARALDSDQSLRGRFYCTTDDYLELVIGERVPDA